MEFEVSMSNMMLGFAPEPAPPITGTFAISVTVASAAGASIDVNKSASAKTVAFIRTKALNFMKHPNQ
jgi:hypothetical protein